MTLLALVFFISVFWIVLIAKLSATVDWLSPFATPITIAPLLVALLLHPRIGTVTAFSIALVFGIVNDFSLGATLVGALGGPTMVATVSRARTAHAVARAGWVVALMREVVVSFIAFTNLSS